MTCYGYGTVWCVTACHTIVPSSPIAGDSSNRHYFALCRSRTDEQREEERRENIEKHGAGEEEEVVGDTHTFYVDAVCIPFTIALHLTSPTTSPQVT